MNRASIWAASVGHVFVGREREIQELEAALRDASAGRGRLVLLFGEPGIGKTRLAERTAEAASPRGFTAIWGRCWEGGGAPPYWPWVQVLRSLIRGQAPDRLRVHLGRGAAVVAHLVPEIGDRLPDVTAKGAFESDEARFALFDAVASFVESVAAVTPLVLVLDDLHAADQPSLLLLRFMAREFPRLRVLLVGTYRDVEAEQSADALKILGDLAREARRLPLLGLSRDETAQLVERLSGVVPDARLVEKVHDATEGNPFFLDEVLRLLAAEGALTGAVSKIAIPAGVREATRQRLSTLSEDARKVLEAGAVIGKDFDPRIVQAALDLDADRLEVLLTEAGRLGVLTPIAGALGRGSFSHALIREALYDEMEAPYRRQLHRRTAEAVEHLYGTRLDPHFAELAHHWGRAGEASTAVEFYIRAGEQARAQHAYEEAVDHYQSARGALAALPANDERLCEVLLALGEARVRAGDLPTGRQTFLEAADIARRIGSASRLGRAALGYGSGSVLHSIGYRPSRKLIALLEESLSAVGASDQSVRVRLLARLAIEMYWTTQYERGDVLATEANETAEGLDDKRLLLFARYASTLGLTGPHQRENLLRAANDVIALGHDVDDHEMVYLGHAIKMGAASEIGDIAGVETEFEICRRISDDLPSPILRARTKLMQTRIALSQGRFSDVERLRKEASALEGHADEISGFGVLFVVIVKLMQGDFEGLEPVLSAADFPYGRHPVMQFVRAHVKAALGKTAEAAVILDGVTPSGIARLPMNSTWLMAMYFAALTEARIGDRERARIVYDLLLPYRDRFATSGAGGSTTNFGSVATALGAVAAVLGRWGEAFDHFEYARRRSEVTRNRVSLAFALEEHATALLRHGGPDDVARAIELANRAVALFREMEAEPRGERLEAMLEDVRSRAPVDGRIASLRLEDGEWAVAHAGQTMRLPDLRGLRHLRTLLGRPYAEIHVLELVALAEGRAPSGLESSVGDAGELLDESARAAYRRRLEELRVEKDEARALGDARREDRADTEIEALTRELAAAVGLAGRHRKAASTEERARVAVTKAIRTAIDRITQVLPPLGAHLARAVRTGTYCSYFPAADEALTWQL